MKWHKDRRAEAKLRELGVKFRYEPALKFSDIDLKRSAENRARVEHKPLIDDVILSYAIAMEKDEADFPSPIVYANGKKYILCDGNQRCNAYKEVCERGAKIGCYVLETDDVAVIELVTRCFNTINGVGQSKTEKTEHVLFLLGKYPDMTQTDLARTFGIKRDQVSHAARVKGVNDHLEKKKIDTRRVSNRVLDELSKLSDSEPVLEYVGRVACDYKLTGEQTKDIVHGIKQKRSEAARMAEAAAWEERYAARRPGMGRKNTFMRRDTFLRMMSRLIAYVAKNPSKEALQLTAKVDLLSAEADWEKTKTVIDKVFANGS